MPNTRLKRLLDKKKSALAMPKYKLADYEDEYVELLRRINEERKKLGIDSESILAIKEKYARTEGTVAWYLKIYPGFQKEINNIEKELNKAAASGDIENVKYYERKLKKAWQTITEKAYENQQVTML